MTQSDILRADANGGSTDDGVAGKRRLAPTERRTFERARAQRPGNAVERVRRARFQFFLRTAEAHLEARPKNLAGVLKRWLVGAPIHAALRATRG